jgi:A/G-specific adenine glycosylase
LCQWYTENARDLPWRKDKNAYFIWLSEIILQQTRVIQGLAYYLRFIKKYPTIEMLAKANIDDVMRQWQGLGYYSRARNLHETAKQIAFDLNGRFPKTYIELLKLKGIGKYTAAAIASISYGEEVPVVDGNVYRVLARLLGIFTPINTTNAYNEFASHAKKFLAKNNPGNTNQAIMELGALVCLPKNPKCNNCPINTYCFAFHHQKIDDLPVKSKPNLAKKRYLNYLVITQGHRIIVKKRDENDIWKGLYDFPLVETSKAISLRKLLEQPLVKEILNLTKSDFCGVSKPILHKLTHQHITAKFFGFKLSKINTKGRSEFQFITLTKLEQLAKPRLIEKFLENDFAFKK